MRCAWCRKTVKRLSNGLCYRCEGRVVKRDRFWVIMALVPLVLMAGLGTVLVVFATAR